MIKPRVLIVSATEMELSWLRSMVEKQPCQHLEPYWLITGVSMVSAAWNLATFLAYHRVEAAIQVGIAGTLRNDWALGSVVEVREEVFSELGAESPDGFLSLRNLGFPLMQLPGTIFFESLPNPFPPQTQLPAARGQTVNKVHGLAETIEEVRSRCQAEVESMEGGAFFFAMLHQGAPFVELRGLSNRVEPRDRAAWKLAEAARAAQKEALDLLRRWDQPGELALLFPSHQHS